MEFNNEYIRSLMPNGPTKEEQRINKQWERIQKQIIRRAKHGYDIYECFFGDYDQKIWQLLSLNGFEVYKDWQSGHVEIRW